MSRTIKRYPYGIYRRTRGYRRAIRAGVRCKAVPPNSWGDIHHDRQCWTPLRVAKRMRRDGASPAETLKCIRKKFGLCQQRAEDVIRWAYWDVFV